jgi:hypothetical protein
VDFTREPIVETVITPKDGWTLVIRSSKGVGQEEYFVDAVEIVTFGSISFFRSQERPKSFMVPVSDYEVIEVRETRMVLKNITLDRSIKIGSGKEFLSRAPKEQGPERSPMPIEPQVSESEMAVPQLPTRDDKVADVRFEKKRDRKRNFRRKRAREDVAFREEDGSVSSEDAIEGASAPVPSLTAAISSLLPPPPTLISDTIARYKDNALFKGAFFSKDDVSTPEEVESPIEEIQLPEEELSGMEDLGLPELPQISLDFPVYGMEFAPAAPQEAAFENAPEPSFVDAPEASIVDVPESNFEGAQETSIVDVQEPNFVDIQEAGTGEELPEGNEENKDDPSLCP